MKTILAYGDSITWGSDPTRGGARHPASHRWPEVMARELGSGFTVISEGLRGRTTAFPLNQADCDRNGAAILPTMLYSHAPLDAVILMLGTNDLQAIVCGRAIGALQGMRRLVEITQRHATRLPGDAARVPKVLVVAPPPLVETEDPFFDELFSEAILESRKIAPLYAALAEETGVAFFDAGTVAQCHPADGVHLDAENTAAIGRALAPVIAGLLAA